MDDDVPARGDGGSGPPEDVEAAPEVVPFSGVGEFAREDELLANSRIGEVDDEGPVRSARPADGDPQSDGGRDHVQAEIVLVLAEQTDAPGSGNGQTRSS